MFGWGFVILDVFAVDGVVRYLIRTGGDSIAILMLAGTAVRWLLSVRMGLHTVLGEFDALDTGHTEAMVAGHQNEIGGECVTAITRL